MNLHDVRFYGAKCQLLNHVLIRLKGKDSHKFFQAHGTNNFNSLEENCFQLDCRLDVSGKLQAFFYSAKIHDDVVLVTPRECSDSAVSNLEKYIIMEDVEVSLLDEEIICVISPFIDEIKNNLPNTSCFMSGRYLNEDALFIWGENKEIANQINLPELGQDIEKQLRVLSAWPVWSEKLDQRIVNETSLEEYAVSYSKGCFLGQETVAKIHNNRGAAYYPVIAKSSDLSLEDVGKEFKVADRKGGRVLDFVHLESSGFALIELFRDFRVEDSELEISFDNENKKIKVNSFPFFKNNSRKDKSEELYELAIECFQKDNFNDAISNLEHCIELNSVFADAYETLGVIKGKQGKYEEGIALMDELLKADPESILAHTNKSLFYMNMGRIEEAEEEKARATAKSFEMADKNASINDIQLQERQRKEQELQKRESMFLQVLEIDAEDGLANFGMGEICFHRKNYSKTVEYIRKVLAAEPENSNAYLLLGKALEGLGNQVEAKEIYDKGIKIASKKGQHKQANEMHSRLGSL